MSFIYRSALTITRKQPYIDWANGLEDDGPPTADLTLDRKAIYLIPEYDISPTASAVLDACWEAIFEEELAMWVEDEAAWPQPLTRQLFDVWFDAEIISSVFDLTPGEALTQSEVDIADLHDTMMHCAWCEIDLEPEKGRFVAFTLGDRERLAHRAGLVLPVLVGRERIVNGIMSLSVSEEAANGEDLIFRACTSRCEKLIRKSVPKALNRLLNTAGSRIG